MDINREQFLVVSILIAAAANAAIILPTSVWLQAPLGLLFLFVLPGSLILAAIADNDITGAERIIYTVAASISFIMFVGLVLNTLLPLAGINAPLRTLPVLFGFDAVLASLSIYVYMKYEERPVMQIALPQLDRFNSVVLLLPVIAAGASVAGARLLNSGGTNLMSMLAIGIAAITILTLIIFRNRIHLSSYAWILFLIGLGVLYMGWIRSNFVSGVDIDVEFRLFQATFQHGHWSLASLNDAYNACLSITIFPAIIRALTAIPDMFVFKVVIPAIFALTPVALYAFLRRYVEPFYAFLGAMLFISQEAFTVWWLIPIKQEVGLFFFGVIILLLFSHNIPRNRQLLLLVIFAISMVVSHYTTAYIAIAIFLVTLLSARLFEAAGTISLTKPLVEKLKLKDPRKSIRKERALSLFFVFILIGATYLWYFEVTNTGSSTVSAVHTIVSNVGNIFSDNSHQAETIGSILNPFYQDQPQQQVLQGYYNDIKQQASLEASTTKLYPASSYSDFNASVIADNTSPVQAGKSVAQYANTANSLVKGVIKLLLCLGVGIMLFRLLRKGYISADTVMLCIWAFIILAATVLLPFASVVYSISRAYQQLIIVLALPFALALAFLGKLSPRWSIAVIAILILSPYLFYTGFTPQLTGGQVPSVELNNAGRTYEEIYTHSADLRAGDWVFSQNTSEDIYAGARASEKLWLTSAYDPSRVTVNVFPPKIQVESFVFADYTNTNEGKAFASIASETVAYPFPSHFLDTYKNLIYTNGYAEVYK